MRRILFQFCSSKDIKIFEKNHYVRKMTAVGRTDKSKAVGEVRGHHGQQVHYLIWYEAEPGWENVGAISGGSAIFSSSVRDKFFGLDKLPKPRKGESSPYLSGIIDNTLFRLEYSSDRTACVYGEEDTKKRKCLNPDHNHNLASKIVSLWRKMVVKDWEGLYGVKPYGFETFVEYEEIDATRQRVGMLYAADNWTRVGETAGNTKNHVGRGLTGGLHGNPFSREQVSKKIAFCKWIEPFTEPQICDYKSSWRGQTPEEKRLAKARSSWRKTRVEDSAAELKAAGVPLTD